MIETERLRVRDWVEADRWLFHAHCGDPEIGRYLPPVDLDAAFDAMLAGIQGAGGHGFWVIERRADGAAIGACGMLPGTAGTPIAGQTEIGWRLEGAWVGQGYAREAAQAVIARAWATGDTAEIVAITVPANAASRRLMERLGMRRDPAEDFDHPLLAEGSPHRRHLVYRLPRP